MVIHRQSKCVICIHCKKGFPLETVLKEHFTRVHRLPTFINRQNERNGDDLTIDGLQQRLHDAGAGYMSEHGLYYTPLKDAMPMISVLDVKEGYMCGYCPVGGVTATAKFTGTRSTMHNHMSSDHRGMASNNYSPYFVQHLFGEQVHKVYFKVKKYYEGETMETTFTEAALVDLEKFKSMNPSYSNAYNPNDDVRDSRVFSRFYLSVNWYGLVPIIAGEDTQETGVSLNKWTHGINDMQSPHTTAQGILDLWKNSIT